MSKKKIHNILYKEIGSVMIKDIIFEGIDKEDRPKTKVNPNKVLKNWIEEEYLIIDSINYQPKQEIFYTENNKTYFNIYKKSRILTNHKKQKDFNFKYTKKVLMNLVEKNKDDYNYVCKWLGWQLQHPTHRLPTSIIFQGEQGTGKSKFCDLVLSPIFDKNFIDADYETIKRPVSQGGLWYLADKIKFLEIL
jgi:hypothetical protein